MAALWTLIEVILWIFLILLIVRLVFDWVQVFAPEWRPRGGLLVVLEFCYSITDPPLRALRRVVPPVRIGRFGLDIAWIGLFIGVVILQSVVASL
ncbi:MAG: YggT family protein [Acidothermus cellulolyticus]|nr:YggT family protein [Acidothermus cellulolyticus]MCL6550998.1 YggT family protein [Acidothermus cellulolyticus]